MITLNVGALVDLSRAYFEPLTAAGTGVLINVASLLGFQPTPYLSVYGATKAFVLSFTESLWEETRGTGLRVLAVCPGATRTEFYDAAGSQSADYGSRARNPPGRRPDRSGDPRPSLRATVGDHQRPPARPRQQGPAAPPNRPADGPDGPPSAHAAPRRPH